MLWKHVDPVAGAEVRRSRRLVVSFHATVANYEYLVYWRFYQDGNIECEVRATGIMVTTSFPEGEQPPYGTLVDERTYAPFHQHFIVARLDLDIDGEANTVHMTESEALPIGAGQPERPGDRAAQHPAAHRGGGQAGLRLEHPARLEDRERRERPTGWARRWPTSWCPAAHFPAMIDPSSPRLPARTGDRTHALGHALRRGRALALRRVPGADRGGHRPTAPGPRPTADREHRRGALVRVRASTTHAARGVAGDAGGHRLVLAQARPASSTATPRSTSSAVKPRRRDPRRDRRRGAWMEDLLAAPGRGAHAAGQEVRGRGHPRGLLRDRARAVGRAAGRRRTAGPPWGLPFSWEVADKTNVVADWDPSEPADGRSLVLNGHIDVVSPAPDDVGLPARLWPAAMATGSTAAAQAT